MSERDIISTGADIDTGQYTLTLVATAGPSAGASAQGGLWLVSPHATSGATSSPPAERGRPELPLYGATAVDFAGVSAPVPEENSTVPSPHSFNPQRPGVLVRYRADTANGTGVWRLYIATNRNDQRVCHPGTPCWDRAADEGPGVVLDVHKIDSSGFAGSWRPVAGGDARGYFCAAPVQYYAPFKSRPVPRPPPTH